MKLNSNNWKKAKLDNLCRVVSGGTPSTAKTDFWGGEIPWITPMDLSKHKTTYIEKGSRNISRLGLKNSSAELIPPKSLIMSSRAPIGYLAINKVQVTTNQGCKSFVCGKEIDVEYLYYYLAYHMDDVRRLGSGSTFAEVGKRQLENLEIVYPVSIEEQRKIVEILSNIDKAIENTDKLINKSEELKEGLAHRLTSKEGGLKYKLRDISEITSSKRVMVSDYVSQGVPFYRSTEVIKKSKNAPLDNVLHISSEKYKFFKERFGAPQDGDILVTAVGTIGNVYLVQKETFYFKDGNLLWIRNIKNNVLPEYLKVILSSKLYSQKLNTIAGGSSQKALTIEKMGAVDIVIPSLEVQEETVDIISSADNKQGVNIKYLNNLNDLKRGIMQNIFNNI